MRLTKKLTKPEVFIRLGLGLTFLYSGYDTYTNPDNWLWYLEQTPPWFLDPITQYIGIDLFLRLQGVIELLLSAIFLIWFLPRWILKVGAFIASIKLATILWLLGLDSITFRDIGLLGASLAMLSFTYRRR